MGVDRQAVDQRLAAGPLAGYVLHVDERVPAVRTHRELDVVEPVHRLVRGPRHVHVPVWRDDNRGELVVGAVGGVPRAHGGQPAAPPVRGLAHVGVLVCRCGTHASPSDIDVPATVDRRGEEREGREGEDDVRDIVHLLVEPQLGAPDEPARGVELRDPDVRGARACIDADVEQIDVAARIGEDGRTKVRDGRAKAHDVATGRPWHRVVVRAGDQGREKETRPKESRYEDRQHDELSY